MHVTYIVYVPEKKINKITKKAKEHLLPNVFR